MRHFKGFGCPEVLVSTDWLAENLHKTDVMRLVESDGDARLYKAGHIENAVHIDWGRDLNDPVSRDYLDDHQFAGLMEKLGISHETTVIFYGDSSNWWAAYAFWVFKLFGHARCRLLDGGRQKWLAAGHYLTVDVPVFVNEPYRLRPRSDYRIRASRDQVLASIEAGQPIVDVRSPQEYRGELRHMAGMPQNGILRAGHVPTAISIPWHRTINEDGTFKDIEKLRAIYEVEQQLRWDRPIITYCRLGERSAHTWFVLTYLLGYPHVANYDGSWKEWGNLINVPIENPSVQRVG